MRFLTAFYSILEDKEIIIKGSKRMHERPIYPLIDCLKLIGADISYLEKDGFPPIKIKGKKLNFKKVQISSNVSSQFVSAILLVAPKLIGGLVIELKGELISKPYIEMTLSLLNDLGIKTRFNGKSITVENLEKIQQKNISVESDWSSASYWYSIVALSEEAEVGLNNFFKDSIQGDSVLTKYYKILGVETKFTQNKIILTKLKDFTPPQELNLNLMWESEVPIPVCILDLLASLSASAATSMSFFTARVNPQTLAFLINCAILTTESKSPGLEIGNPASKTSTPNSSKRSAIISLLCVSNLHPGTCSPSRKVVSKICTFSLHI